MATISEKDSLINSPQKIQITRLSPRKNAKNPSKRGETPDESSSSSYETVSESEYTWVTDHGTSDEAEYDDEKIEKKTGDEENPPGRDKTGASKRPRKIQSKSSQKRPEKSEMKTIRLGDQNGPIMTGDDIFHGCQIDYEIAVWVLTTLMIAMAVMDRFTFNVMPMGINDKSPFVEDRANWSMSTFKLWGWIAGRTLLVSANTVMLLQCRVCMNWFVENCPKWIHVNGDIIAINNRIHYWIAIVYIGIPVCLHVWTLIFPAILQNQIVTYTHWERHEDEIPLLDSDNKAITLSIEEWYRIVSTTFIWLFIFPLTMIIKIQSKNWSLAMYLHALGAWWYLSLLIGTKTNPHSHIFNAPIVFIYVCDRLYGIFFYRRYAVSIVRKLYFPGENGKGGYMIVYVRNNLEIQAIRRMMGDIYFLNMLDCGFDRAHPFTSFNNYGKNSEIANLKVVEPHWEGHKFAIGRIKNQGGGTGRGSMGVETIRRGTLRLGALRDTDSLKSGISEYNRGKNPIETPVKKKRSNQNETEQKNGGRRSNENEREREDIEESGTELSRLVMIRYDTPTFTATESGMLSPSFRALGGGPPPPDPAAGKGALDGYLKEIDLNNLDSWQSPMAGNHSNHPVPRRIVGGGPMKALGVPSESADTMTMIGGRNRLKNISSNKSYASSYQSMNKETEKEHDYESWKNDWDTAFVIKVFERHDGRMPWTRHLASIPPQQICGLRSFGPFRSEYSNLERQIQIGPNMPQLVLMATGAGCPYILDFYHFITRNAHGKRKSKGIEKLHNKVTVYFSCRNMGLFQYFTDITCERHIPNWFVNAHLTRHDHIEYVSNFSSSNSDHPFKSPAGGGGPGGSRRQHTHRESALGRMSFDEILANCDSSAEVYFCGSPILQQRISRLCEQLKLNFHEGHVFLS